METGFLVRTAAVIAALLAASAVAIAQPPPALDLNAKFHIHAERSFGPAAMGVRFTRAGILQLTGSPTEWGQGTSGYARRAASSLAASGIRNALAFGLDSALRQDPRYFRSTGRGFWQRTRHALRGTIMTRTDDGGETFSTWRFGSAYGAAFISNQWHPDRLNTARRGIAGGSIRLGFDFATNVAVEFWPDIKQKFLRRKT